jgi:hypothetical protein
MMSWLSRLLPIDRGLRRRARTGDLGRLHGRGGRRRTIALERLESRTVLNGGVIASTSSSGALTILGDIFNDSFSIMESTSGTVIVTGSGTLVNMTHKPYTSPPNVKSISVTLPGIVSFDTVSLMGPGKTTPTPTGNVSISAVGANVNFTASGVDNTGVLNISNTAGTGLASHAVLSATVDTSTFPGGISMTQTGDATSAMELGNDSTAGVSPVLGPVTVSEGVGNSDSIILNAGDTFGVTKLIEGAGPTSATGIGTADSIAVNSASVTTLAVTQGLTPASFPGLPPTSLTGAMNSVMINTLSVAQNNSGVTIAQGDSAGATTTITGVTTPSPLAPMLVTPGIAVTQGRGAGDSASVLNSTLPGSISIIQSDVAGSTGDSATLSSDIVGATVTSGSQVFVLPGNLSIQQGGGNGDSALIGVSPTTGIGASTATGNVSITQGNGPGDSATVSGVTAGIELTISPYFSGGDISIIQGSGSGGAASVLNSIAVNSVFVTQGDVAGNLLGDTVTIDGVTAGMELPVIPDDYGNIIIQQGTAIGDVTTITASTAVGQIICC